MSSTTQTLHVTSGVASCDQAAGANVCRIGGAEFEDITLAAMLGLDAWNSTIWPGLKFPLPAPSGTPLDPDEPDQRPDPKKA